MVVHQQAMFTLDIPGCRKEVIRDCKECVQGMCTKNVYKEFPYKFPNELICLECTDAVAWLFGNVVLVSTAALVILRMGAVSTLALK